MTDDAALLQQFVARRCDRAFAELVSRYVDLVWSSARRQTGSSALAEDIAQQVFATLAQKAGSIRAGESVGGWLLVTTRYTALNALRAEARRRHHEREAAQMNREQHSAGDPAVDPSWPAVSPLLDEAVEKLKREDRDALVLRYFQGRSVADVARALNVSPEAAQKRVSRAVERLRAWFTARGVSTSAEALGMMLGAHAVYHAPAALTAKLAAAAAATSAATATTSAAGKGLFAIMATLNAKAVALGAAAVLFVGVAGKIAYQTFNTPRSGDVRQIKVDPAVAAAVEQPVLAVSTPPTPEEQWLPGFRQRYALKPGEIVKFVPRPFIPERIGFYRKELGESQFQAIPAGPDIMLIEDDGTRLGETRAMFGGPPTVTHGAEFVLGIESWDLRGPDKLRRLPMRGDWVVRKDTTRQERTTAFLTEISALNKASVHLIEETIPREAVVIRGKLNVRPLMDELAADGRRPPVVVFYRGKFDPKQSHGAGGGFDTRIAMLCDMPVINEAGIKYSDVIVYTGPNAEIRARPGDPQRDSQIDELLKNLAAQTSLQFKREKRTLPLWTLEAAK